MIYITFFIVILISKRGVREALRERERENQYRYKYRYKIPIPIRIQIPIQSVHHRHTTAIESSEARHTEAEKRYDQKEVLPSAGTERKRGTAAPRQKEVSSDHRLEKKV